MLKNQNKKNISFNVDGIYQENFYFKEICLISWNINKYLLEILGVHFKKALLVPNISVYHKVGSHALSTDSQVDLSWQFTIQRVWENLVLGNKGIDRIHCTLYYRFYSSLLFFNELIRYLNFLVN